MRINQVDPETFIKQSRQEPLHGRGAWNRTGIDFDYRYAMSEDPAQRIGTRAEVSLAHWAVAAGSYAIQQRLVTLGLMKPLAENEWGIFGPRTKTAVKVFQVQSVDPVTGKTLTDDGTVGISDARTLWLPVVLAAERKYGIPRRLLLGQTNFESSLDPGAVGYFIYYPDYRGVDRAMSQINSRANAQVTWLQAFDPVFSLDWSAKRMRSFYDQYRAKYVKQTGDVLWDAACCAHNSPVNGNAWAGNGGPTNETAKTYMNGIYKSIW